MSGGPAIDSDGRVVGLTSFAWIQSTGGRARSSSHPDSIREVLNDLTIQTEQGPIDQRFQEGMNLFWNHEYTDAIEPLQAVTRLRDGISLPRQRSPTPRSSPERTRISLPRSTRAACPGGDGC